MGRAPAVAGRGRGRAASAIAVALAAEALVLLSNVPGLLRDFPDEANLVPRVAAAVAGGVTRALLADGRRASPLRRSLAGHGTVVA